MKYPVVTKLNRSLQNSSKQNYQIQVQPKSMKKLKCSRI